MALTDSDSSGSEPSSARETEVLPAPGAVTLFSPPAGPGVRLDTSIEQGDVISGQFDSMLAKLIVTGATRQQALERSRRALAEFQVEGMATALTFHRVIVEDPAFAPVDPDQAFSVHTRWIETEFDNTIPAYQGAAAPGEAAADERQSIVVEVGGKRLEVSLPGNLSLGSGGGGGSAASGTAKKKPSSRRSGGRSGGSKASGDSLTAPMQGTVVKVAVEEGQSVAEGDLVVVLEAMKMEQPLNAHKSGVITGLTATVGETVTSGTVLAEIKDAE